MLKRQLSCQQPTWLVAFALSPPPLINPTPSNRNSRVVSTLSIPISAHIHVCGAAQLWLPRQQSPVLICVRTMAQVRVSGSQNPTWPRAALQLLRSQHGGGKFLNTHGLQSVLFSTRKKGFIGRLRGRAQMTPHMESLPFFFYLWIDNYLATPTQTPNQASQFAEATSNEIPRAGEWNFFLINMKELEVLEIASGLSKQALAMMFPRKCLWPETWIRNEEAHSTSWKVKFPHHWFLSLQCRAAPENVFSSLPLAMA